MRAFPVATFKNVPNAAPRPAISNTKDDLDALSRFTLGRWLWREQEQLACRYVKFELQELLDIAASVSSEGQYNKVLFLTMANGCEIIAKLPNPNAGRPHFTTASEVATMDFLRNLLNLPVPRVYAWSSRATGNPVSAVYILIEKQPGVMLSDAWDSLKGKQRAQLVLQVVDFEKTLAATKINGFGSFGKEVQSTKFAIGPTNHRTFFDFGRGSLDIDRGPWASTIEFMTAVAKREIATVAPYTLPENSATHTSVLWHGDLNLQNIFVDPKEPTRILGIIDWQSVSLFPLFTQATRPAFLEYNGPLPETLDKVRLPENFESLNPAEQQKAKALHQAQTLHNLYLARSRQMNPVVFEAIQGQKTLRHQVSVIPGLTIMDYEPCFNSLLRDIQKEWRSIVGQKSDGTSSITCPLQFSADEVQEQERNEELWAQGVRLMEEFTSDTGCFKHWDGRVNEQDYEPSRRQLDEGLERFLQREARSKEEQREWLEALPFVY
ncbi:kinase-like domain-containing protein [Aspergillus transmontanensis]|uniref:Altered inheritance of mitochondria protein 9, mitochondrial n=1 Tax=Aspergillus transmontanensis TaxID=1034304 RepID=A0A5N6W2M8_9EURO|nr:kinase-like domain-containing protein [Aspergillus transmontanensis]